MGVTALDHDIGGNGQVVYTLTGSSKFAINSQTGILTASQTLSTARATYKFLIKAEDQVRGMNSFAVVLSCFLHYGQR